MRRLNTACKILNRTGERRGGEGGGGREEGFSTPFVVHAVESHFLQDGDRYHRPDTSPVANYTVKHGLTTSRGRGGGKRSARL